MLSSLFASIHYLAFAVGLGSVFIRGVCLRKIAQSPRDPALLKSLFTADNFWGGTAVFLIATGLMRAFGGLEKGTAYYLQNHLFWGKMALLIAILVMELRPAIFLIRWRMAVAKNKEFKNLASLPALIRINNIEILLMILIPFTASAMARGL
jgi:putative membrane protein